MMALHSSVSLTEECSLGLLWHFSGFEPSTILEGLECSVWTSYWIFLCLLLSLSWVWSSAFEVDPQHSWFLQFSSAANSCIFSLYALHQYSSHLDHHKIDQIHQRYLFLYPNCTSFCSIKFLRVSMKQGQKQMLNLQSWPDPLKL